MNRPEEVNDCLVDIGPDAEELELYINLLEHQRDQLREALESWLEAEDSPEAWMACRDKARAVLKAMERDH